MSLRVVLLTRSWRPSGAQMAWRLVESGFSPVAIVVEKRGRMVTRTDSGPAFWFHVGIPFLWKRVLEATRIYGHYGLRKLLKKRFQNPEYLSVEEWSLDHSVPIYHVDDHNGREARDLLQRLQPDIGILTNTRRIRERILTIPVHGFLNLHLSLLPQYAGLDSIFWALYHGEKEIGVTIHRAAEAIDRGDIVLQEKIAVSDLDDEETLYSKALWLGTRLMVRALHQLEEGRWETRPQDRGRASYFSWPSWRERAGFYKCRKRERSRAGRRFSSENRRVLHIITRMIRGGAQQNTLATAGGLVKKGYEVTLATGPAWGNEGEIVSEAMEQGVEVVILPELIRPIHIWKDLVSFFRIMRLLVRKKVDIVHTHTSKAGFLGRMAAHLRKVPIVIHTPHGHVFHSYFPHWKENFFLALERKGAEWCDRLIALTQAERKEHLDLGVGKGEDWLVIPSGIDENRFRDISPERKGEIRESLRIPLGRRIVGFVGRLTPIKGVRYLVEAMAPILRDFPEVHFLFVGDGDERSLLQERVRVLGLQDRVTFAGHRRNVSDFLALADVLVVPSLNEGMGRVIAEAGLLGKAVVGTRVGGIPDLIRDQETGLLVERRNPDEIARAVLRLLHDPVFSRALGNRLQDDVLQGFTESMMIEKIDRLYQNLLRQKGRGSDSSRKAGETQDRSDEEPKRVQPSQITQTV